MLYGRATESAAIDSLLAQARCGQGGGLALRGEPGIGKTALLDHTASRATDMRVLHTAGTEPESGLAYAALHRLLLPVLAHVGQLPEPQARALDVVFGRATGDAPDRFLVGLATLSLLCQAAEDQPVLCLVDDVHACDEPSRQALAFTARRLRNEPVALVLATRPGEGQLSDTSGLTELPLSGLDREAALALFSARVQPSLPGPALDALLHATGGNPLAIREIPARHHVSGGDPPPLGEGLRQAFLERVHQHDPAAQRVLLLIAAAGTAPVATIREATVMQGDEPGALDRLGDLVAEDGPNLACRHPLVRSAVYHSAAPDDRRRAHRALAAALDGAPAGADHRAWHLGRAADGPDEEVAAELERSARRAAERAGPGGAGATLARSAALTPSAAHRARRFVAAADAHWQSGDTVRAAALLEQAELGEQNGPDQDPLLLDAVGLRASIELRAGRPDEAVALLRPVLVPLLRTTDPRRAVHLLMLLKEASLLANAVADWNATVRVIADIPLPGTDDDSVLMRLFQAAHRVTTGLHTEPAAEDLATAERFTDPARLCWAGFLARIIGDRESGTRLLRESARRARVSGAAGVLAWALRNLVSDDLAASRLTTAQARAEEGHRLAMEAGQPNTACVHNGSLAVIAALRGEDARARELGGKVLAEADERGLVSVAVYVNQALGLLDLAAGHSYEALRRLRAPGRKETTHPGLSLDMVPAFVEAAVRAGETGLAEEAFASLALWAEATDSPGPQGLTAHCRGLLSTGATAATAYSSAAELYERADWPMERAYAELLLGEHLRRKRRRGDARRLLLSALETFQRTGTLVWADRTRSELRATGDTGRRRDPSRFTELTPQEVRIVTAVSEGSTNREVAAQLFLSPRTIDYHLRKVFQKLNIGSRTELVRLALAEGLGTGGSPPRIRM